MASDDEVGREAARYIRFASAAYGLVMLKVKRRLHGHLVRIQIFLSLSYCEEGMRDVARDLRSFQLCASYLEQSVPLISCIMSRTLSDHVIARHGCGV